MKRVISLLIVLIFITGCESNTIGPCVHIYEEPVLNITSVTGESEITEITVSDIRLDDEEIHLELLTSEPAENVVLQDSLLICSVPCGFGTDSGEYTFTIAAEGYPDKTVAVDADYGSSAGGCPSSSWDGTKVGFTFNR